MAKKTAEKIRLSPDDERLDYLSAYMRKQGVIQFARSDSSNVFCCPAKKRGNKSYNYFLYKRFGDLEANIKTLVDIDESGGYSNAMMITLTYPTGHNSWHDYKTANKLYFDRLRKNPIIAATLGKFQYINVIESTRAGTLHCHALLLFEKQFKFVKVARKNRENYYGMICDKALREAFKSSWENLSDVSAVYSIGGALTYVQKYYKKQFQNLELLIDRAKKDSITIEEYKALLCFYHVIRNKLRMFRASRLVSQSKPKAEADSLDVLLNKCESVSWSFVGIQNYWPFRDGIKHHFGAAFDFHLMNSIVFDSDGGLVAVEFNKMYVAHAIGAPNSGENIA